MTSTWLVEIETAVPAPRLFKAGVLDWHNLAPKLAPEKIVSAAPVEGTGEAGSIRQFNFAAGGPFTVVKERLDFVDVANCEIRSTLIEGGGLGIHIESGSNHIKVDPKAGGSVVKVTNTYAPLPGVNIEAEIEKGKQSLTDMFKGCETYLIANPDAYN